MTVEELLAKLQNTKGDVEIITSEGQIDDIIGHFDNNGIINEIVIVVR